MPRWVGAAATTLSALRVVRCGVFTKVCSSVLQCVALQCVAVCCSVLQCVAVCCSVLQSDAVLL